MSECVTGAETVNGVPVKYRNGAKRSEETLWGNVRDGSGNRKRGPRKVPQRSNAERGNFAGQKPQA